jgi:tetratricopeptide (TPR) repeat protein
MQDLALKDSPPVSGRIHSIIKRLCFFALICLGLSLFAQKIIDTDIWWHLSAGRYIVQNHAIPSTDPFSYTAAGNEWIDLHWLFQVIIYGVYRALGSYGLSLLFIIIYSAAFFIAWLTCRRDNPPFITLLFLWLGLMAASSRFLARPEAFTYLMLALYMLILLWHEQGKAGRWIYLLIPLQVLWTNLQGLFILGPCLIFAFALKIRGKNRDRYHFLAPEKSYLSLFLLSIAASLINPYGIKGLLFPLILFTRAGGIENIFAGSIAELQPPFSGYNLTTPLIYFGVFVALSILSLALDWKNAKLSHIIIFLGMGYLGLSARRNVPVFIFSALPLAVGHANNFLGNWHQSFDNNRRHFRQLKAAGYALVLAGIILQAFQVWTNSFYISDKRAERFGFGFKEQTFPEGAFAFIKREGLRGPFFNSLDNGGMFIWELYPSERVFLDPRLEVNSEATFAEYSALASWRHFQALVYKYGFNAAIVSHTSQDGLYLVPIIYNTPGWSLVYLDPIAAVFARETPENESVIAANQIDVAQNSIPPFAPDDSLNDTTPAPVKTILDSIASIAPSDAEAQNRFSLGLVYIMLGQNVRAADELRAGLKLKPYDPNGYYNLGVAFTREGCFDKASECFKNAIELDHNYALAHLALGEIYDKQGLKDEAEREYRLSLKSDGNNTIALYNLGALYYEKGLYTDARRCWERILKKNPLFQPAQEALKRLDGLES